MLAAMTTLRDHLSYEPVALAFGTSGLRGRVADITNLEAYVNTAAWLRYLFAASKGGIQRGDTVFLASDLRPSSDARVEGRGEIAQAVARAVRDAGCGLAYLGQIPTPALTYHAMQQGSASVMVTGSHIPFDRNGIKFNRRDGEVLKSDEAGILAEVARVREEVYAAPFVESIFDEHGMVREPFDLPLPSADGRNAYLRRYLAFFPRDALRGLKVTVYQHSALARDILVQLLLVLGAEVMPVGRSDTFVPIDTEDVKDELMAQLQAMVAPGSHALVSTDGDSDRPLVVSVRDGIARFHSGDLLGIVVAERLRADAVAVPVTSNDAVDAVFGDRLLPRTRVGSPYVIEGMRRARGQRIVGFEANGGFMTGSDIDATGFLAAAAGRSDQRLLRALPTRDAVLPILTVLAAAVAETGCDVGALFDRLPRRATRAGLIDDFPVDASRAILAHFSSDTPDVRAELERTFGLGAVRSLDFTDGLRIRFASNDVAHVRPSGNAPQLRIYATADTQDRADAMVAAALAEPDGTLRRLERSLYR